ncbi:MAG TPA: ABC transporter substrate-binding protein [Solirubrobacteraceae bacterium]|nr:ABC transporter substrate-binding protein [Solirubrobacteraceae bacterium]
MTDRDSGLTRRDLLRSAAAGGVALGAGGLLSGCAGVQPGTGAIKGSPQTVAAKLRRGGSMLVGATGGGSTDTIDAHVPVSDPDIMRVWNLYEALAVRSPDFSTIDYLVAESIEPEHGDAASWIITLRHGIEFHNGKTVAPEDVIFSLQRIIDPKDPKTGASSIGYIDLNGLKQVGPRQLRVPLKYPNAAFVDEIGQYFNAIVPVGYDPKKPVGTGPFMFESFTPGAQSVFKRFPNYWDHPKPWVDELTIIDFTDDTARVNALLGGQVQAIDNLPTAQIGEVKGYGGYDVLISETGSWQPFTMRVDQAPFSDTRVRQAMRLIADRPQLVLQVLSGQGRIANDLYSPFDPAYDSSLPQRHQDIEKAKFLLKQAGHEGLRVQLTTSPVFQGVVQAAEVFAQQATAAGVTVKLNQVNTTIFYGSNYLKWPFAQDFWATREYLPQVAQGSVPSAPFNECHWAQAGTTDAAMFVKLINEATRTLDTPKRIELLHDAQRLEYENGGYIIPYFSNQIDAYTSKMGGFAEAKSGFPLGNYYFKNVGYLA